MEIPGMTATRRVEETETGTFVVYVKPPGIVGGPEVSVVLSADQFKRYGKWRSGILLIQEALPDLSDSEREMLMTGLTDERFDRIAREYD